MAEFIVGLPIYQSHKKVGALKIKHIQFDSETGGAEITPEEPGYAPFTVDKEYVSKHKPSAGGYFVQYENGYQSWSPSIAFEDGYTKLG